MRIYCWMLPLIVTTAFFAPVPATGQTKRFVQLEVSAAADAPLETQQKWMEVLSDIGADRVRSQTARSVGTTQIVESESSAGTLIKVQGVIDGNQLLLPGRSFQIRDLAGMREYVQRIRDDGSAVALADKKAFGLTSEQLVALNVGLSVPLAVETRNKSAQTVIDFALRNSSFGIDFDGSARQALKRAEPVLDELKGLSLGTAMAAAIRPLGLVLVPYRQQGSEMKLRIVDSKNADEHWPIGWPPTDSPKNTVPKLFEKNRLEIRDFPLDQVLAAVQSKADVPMLIDHNSLARAEIELARTNVTFVEENSSYGFALRKMLNQTEPRMAFEIRLDESGKPFLWISTANPAR